MPPPIFVSLEVGPLAYPRVIVKPSSLMESAPFTTLYELSDLSSALPISPLKIVSFVSQSLSSKFVSVPAKPPNSETLSIS